MKKWQLNFRNYTVVLIGAALSSISVYADERSVSTTLEEVIVTAQKRQELAQDIPIAITAMDAKAIERSFARDLRDITSTAPNVIIDTAFGLNIAAVSIRGMQLNDGEKSFDPAVAVYLDGVYLASTSGALLHTWNAESVEILRGPQGSLFGKNTIGGVVHVKRAKPTGESGGKLALTYGSFERTDVKFAVNAPAVLDGTLATQLSVIKLDGGGYIRNVFLNRDAGSKDFLSVSASALWTPASNTEFLLTYEKIDDDSDPTPMTGMTLLGEAFCNSAEDPGCGRPQQDISYHSKSRSNKESGEMDTDAVTLTGSVELNDVHSLQGVAAWRHTDEFALADFDGVAAFDVDSTRDQFEEQVSLELRLHSQWMDSLRSVFGIYYWDSEYQQDQSTRLPRFFGGPAVNPGDIEDVNRIFDHETTSYAVFGQVDLSVTDQLTLSLGGRWLKEEKKACGQEFVGFLGVGGIVDDVQTLSYGNCPDKPFYENVHSVTGEIITGEESWTNFSPRVNLSYALDFGLAYITYSQGFRSGGFNGRAGDADDVGPYRPEDVESWEVGFKADLMDERLRLNVAAFMIDYMDKQEDVVFPGGPNGTVTIVENASSASINGFEVEATAIVAEGFTLSLSLGLLDASYDEWLVPDTFNPGRVIDKSNFELRRAPEVTASIRALYEYELARGDFLVFSANYSWRDDYHLNANTVTYNDVTPGMQQFGMNESFGTLDLSINYEAEQWVLSLFGKNVLDERYYQNVFDVGTNYTTNSATDRTPVPIPGLWTFGSLNQPATWGAEVRYKF
tara:strand:- start:291 stop:2660 length:2370 start_codon:yes stop_codon:yes gene_type:complete